MTFMFDNSRGIDKAFSLGRVQAKASVLYDCRDTAFSQEQELTAVASTWLTNVAPLSSD